MGRGGTSFTDILGQGRAGTRRAGACWRCHGEGSYMYDENHGKPCEVCCPHGQWWLLSANHGGFSEDHDTWSCGYGCGETRVTEQLECQHTEGWRTLADDEVGFSPYGERWTCGAGCGACREPYEIHDKRLREQHEFEERLQQRERERDERQARLAAARAAEAAETTP